jgi:N-acetylmuramoyl-L-alanine amidase
MAAVGGAASVAATAVIWQLGGSGVGVSDRTGAARTQTASPVGRGGVVTFAADACLAFAPVTPWNGRTVFLDPGHGGPDTGVLASAPGVAASEKQLTVAIARQTLPLLRSRGFRVVVSRSADSMVARLRPRDVRGRLLTAAAVKRDMIARTTCANAADADVLVAIHVNSFVDTAVSGTETLYNPNRSFSARSRRLATLLQRSIVGSLARAGWSTVDRGVFTDAAAGGIPLTRQAAAYDQLMELGPADPPWFRSPSLMPGVVVEPLFLTHPGEARLALTARGRRTIGRGIVRGLELYFAAKRRA